MRCYKCNKQIRRPPFVMDTDACTGKTNFYICAVCAGIRKPRVRKRSDSTKNTKQGGTNNARV